MSSSCTKDLDSIASQTKWNKITIDLSENKFICSCQNRKFLKWALKTKNSKIQLVITARTLCLNNELHSVPMATLKWQDIEYNCRNKLYYIGITIGGTLPVSILLTAAVVCAYRKRWWFRYQWFLAKQIWKRQKEESADITYVYDAFVSYNQNDQGWVDDTLQPMLENIHGLKLCLHHRDFHFGEVITEQIISSIEDSRKTLLILSPNFLSSNWCHFVIQMAHSKLLNTGKDVLLLVLLKPLPKTGCQRH